MTSARALGGGGVGGAEEKSPLGACYVCECACMCVSVCLCVCLKSWGLHWINRGLI